MISLTNVLKCRFILHFLLFDETIADLFKMENFLPGLFLEMFSRKSETIKARRLKHIVDAKFLILNISML